MKIKRSIEISVEPFELIGIPWEDGIAAVDGQILETGQNWSNGSVGYNRGPGPNILASLQYGVRFCHQRTMGKIGMQDAVLFVGFELACAMGSSIEVCDYIKQSFIEIEKLRGANPSKNHVESNLPTRMYGFDIGIFDLGEKIESNTAYMVNIAADRRNRIIPMFKFTNCTG